MNIFLKGRDIKEDCISNVVSLGDFIFVSGQCGQGVTIEEQTELAINKVIKQLASFDLECRHIVKTNIYLKDLQMKPMVLELYKKYFEAPFPACSIVGVDQLEQDAMIMIDAFAINTLRYENKIKESSCGNCHGC